MMTLGVVVANLPVEGDALAVCGKTCAFAGRSCLNLKIYKIIIISKQIQTIQRPLTGGAL